MGRLIISSVEEYSQNGNSICLLCSLSAMDADSSVFESQTVPLTIKFLEPDSFHFLLEASPEADPELLSETISLQPPDTDVDLDVFRDNDELHIVTAEVEVVVGLTDWSFSVCDTNGNSLLEEQRRDVNAKKQLRSNPLGFEVEVVNRWPERVSSAGSSFVLAADENIYGLGEKFTNLNKRGQHITAWITQPNGTETEVAYKNVPLYLSSNGYGMFIDTYQQTEFDFGKESAVTTDVEVDGDTFGFYFFKGSTFKQILRSYTSLTGRPHLPPKWSFGVWMSRLAYKNRDELESVARELRNRQIPCDVLHIDPYWMDIDRVSDLQWNRDAFPQPADMVDALHADGFKISLWEFPYVDVDSPAFAELNEKELLVTDGSSRPYILSRFSVDGRGGILDFTNPNTRDWWKERHIELIQMGVDAFKLDFGEYLPRDATLSNGQTGTKVRNRYPRLYQQTVADAMAATGNDEPTLWTRAGWAGDQIFPIHWGGDPYTSFESMGASLRGGLSLGLSGYQFWSVDIGGFRGEPSPELYVRWAQWGLLGTSNSRFHGTTPREPWEFGEKAEAIVTKYIRERYRLLPYIYSCAARASESGLPVMRPLVLEFEQDPAAWNEDTELLLGESLLVAPVLRPDGNRTVYLPEGEWIDYWTNQRYEGNQSIDLTPDLETLPLFVRAGSVIPRRDSIQSVSLADHPPKLDLRVELPSPGQADTVGDDSQSNDATTRSASFEYYNDTLESFQQVTATAITGTRLTLSFPKSMPVESATIGGVEERPDSVVSNGTELSLVDSEPSPGEWRYTNGTTVHLCVASESSTHD